MLNDAQCLEVFLPGFAAGRPKAIATAATESSSASVAKSVTYGGVLWVGTPKWMVYNGS